MGDIERHMARSDCGQAKASHTRRCGRLLSAQPLFAGRRSIPAALEFRLATRHQGAGVVGRGPQRFVVRGGTRSTAFGPALKRKTDLDAVLAITAAQAGVKNRAQHDNDEKARREHSLLLHYAGTMLCVKN